MTRSGVGKFLGEANGIEWVGDAEREVLSGAIDLHTHPSPDVISRSQSIDECARDFAELGIAGFVVKSHVMPTALLVQDAVGRSVASKPIASIALNNTVGGLNPDAVKASAALGAKIVWLPTANSVLQHRHTGQGIERAIDFGRDGSASRAALSEVVRVAAENDMTLATGHLGFGEASEVLDLAAQCGLERVIITHPCLPHLNYSDAEIIELASRGAWIEHTMNFIATGKVSVDRVLGLIEKAGEGRTLLTGDLGQPEFGSIAGGLAMWARILRSSRMPVARIRQILVANASQAVVLG